MGIAERGRPGAVTATSTLTEAPGGERAVPGLHEAVLDRVMAYPRTGRALDLGTGSGALAARLARLPDLRVEAADIDPSRFRPDLPCHRVDFNDTAFAERIPGVFDIVTAVEVIEHIDGAVGFLRNVGRLLAPDGLAVVTTPNVESIAARIKFLGTGRLRMMDRWADPTHTTPIFLDLLERVYLPASGLCGVERRLYPDGGFVVGRRLFTVALNAARPVWRATGLGGDNHIFVLARADSPRWARTGTGPPRH